MQAHKPTQPPGLERRIWQRLPMLTIGGTLAPVLAAYASHLLSPEDSRSLVWYITIGLVAFHWTMMATLALGCRIVMIMKGPQMHADSLDATNPDDRND